MRNYSPFRSIIKGSGFVLIGNLLIYAISFVYHIPLVRILGPQKYGIWRMVFTIITAVAPLCLLGLDSGLIFYLSKVLSTNSKEKIRGVIFSSFKIVLLSSSIIILGLLVFTNFAVEKIYPFENIKILLIISSFAVPLIAFENLFESMFVSYENARAVYEIKVLRDLFKLFTVPLSLWLTKGNLIVLSILFLTSYIFSTSYAIKLINRFIINLKEFFVTKYESFTKPLLNYSWPLLITSYIQILGKKVDIFFIGFFWGSKYVGIYSPAVILSNLLWIVPMALRFLLFPVINKLFVKNEMKEFYEVTERTFKYMIYLELPLLCFIILFSKNILKILYGIEFEKASISLNLLSIAMALPVFYIISGHILRIYEKTKLIMAINVGGMLFNGIMNYLLIPKYGINGAAFTTLLSSVLIGIGFIISATILIKRFIFPWKSIGVIFFSFAVIILGFLLKTESVIFKLVIYILFLFFVFVWGLIFEKLEIKAGIEFVRNKLKFLRGGNI